MTESDLRVFKRYLKERNLWHAFVIERNKLKERLKGSEPAKLHSLVGIYYSPIDGILSSIDWVYTLNGKMWSEEYLAYARFYNRLKKTNKKNEYFYKIKNFTKCK